VNESCHRTRSRSWERRWRHRRPSCYRVMRMLRRWMRSCNACRMRHSRGIHLCMCNMIHPYVWDRTHSCVWHEWFICVCQCQSSTFEILNMQLQCVQNEALKRHTFMRVARRIHMRENWLIYMCVTWLIYKCVICFIDIYLCGMTLPHV